MPSIYNSVSNYSSIRERRFNSGKLNLNVGESFSGKISKIDKESGEILIKVLDGVEILANLEGNIDEEILGKLIRFDVIENENGKIKIKLSNNDDNGSEIIDKNNSQGEIEESELLSKLLKYDIEINKENVTRTNSILNFLEKINENPNEIDKFIDNILNSKSIDKNSSRGIEIKDILKDFFTSFKELNKNEILTFIENNIEFTKENIQGYKKVFNEKNGLNNLVESMKNEINNLKLENGISKTDNNKLQYLQKELDIKINKNEESKSNTLRPEIKINNLSEKVKIYSNFEPNKNIIDVLRLFDSEKVINNELKLLDYLPENIKQDITNSVKEEFKEALKKSDMNIISKQGENIKKDISKFVLNSFGVELDLTDEDIKKFINEVKSEDINESKNTINIDKESTFRNSNNDKKVASKYNSTSDEVKKDVIRDNTKELIKEQIKEKSNNLKENIKEIIASTRELEENKVGNKLIDIINKNIEEFKPYNNISGKYYYADIPLNLMENMYQCKLIIKDDRAKGKKIDSKNVKMIVSVDTINMGMVDAYLTINEKSLYIDIKCDKEYVKMLDVGSRLLKEKINNMGYMYNITVKEKVKELSLDNCNDFFNDSTISALDIKV